MKIIVYLFVLASAIMLIVGFSEPAAEAMPFLLVSAVLTLYARLVQSNTQHNEIKRLLSAPGEPEKTSQQVPSKKDLQRMLEEKQKDKESDY